MAATFATLATLVSGVFSVALARRWRDGGMRNAALGYWALALAMFFVASLELAQGTLDVWSETTFRVFYLFGAILNVPWLAMGSVQINADNRSVSRAVGWVLTVAGVAVLPLALVAEDSPPLVFLVGGGFVLAWGVAHLRLEGDRLRRASLLLLMLLTGAALASVPVAPLLGVVEPGALPEGRELFGAIPRALAFGGNTSGALVVIVGAVVSWWRQRRTSPSLARGNLLLGVGVGLAGAGGAFSFLGESVGNAVGLGLGVTVMYAGFLLTTRPTGTPVPSSSDLLPTDPEVS